MHRLVAVRTGGRYQGEWVDDKMTGRGYMIWADGRRYDGEWLENRCNGRGVLTYRDGRRYEGEYKLDKMHGRGECRYSCCITVFLFEVVAVAGVVGRIDLRKALLTCAH